MVRVCLCGNASNPKVNISGCALIHLCLDHVVRIILAKMLYHHHNNSIIILIFGHRLKNHGHQSHQIDHIQGKTIFFSLQKFGILFVFFLFYSGSTVIHRPHGSGMLVIRPSNQKRPTSQSHSYAYSTKKPIIIQSTATSATSPNLSENTVPDLDTASSISTGKITLNSFFLWKSDKMIFSFRFMESKCAYNTMACNDTTKFYNKTETNTMGKVAIATSQTKTIKKTNFIVKCNDYCTFRFSKKTDYITNINDIGYNINDNLFNAAYK